MMSADDNCGLPHWILGSTDEGILSQYSDCQSVVCRRSRKPGFNVAAMQQSVGSLFHDNRACGWNTLSILNNFRTIVCVTPDNGVVLSPFYGENVMQNALVKKILLDASSDGVFRFNHLLGLPADDWLVKDIEHCYRDIAPTVFYECAVFDTTFHTKTVRSKIYMHKDDILSMNYGPRATCVAWNQNIKNVITDSNGIDFYEALPEDIMELVADDIARLADPHHTPTTPKWEPLEDRLMMGVEPLRSTYG
jgi:hypothetical protein